ncbi:glutathione S-transferase family protein [Albibacillus kandeliae]|uniref:glutathione S-transferase family protein n=1 Tax=Albibacillus kandeliae TaxID=2174228 RepID=UPI000D686A92|nr:glutathione S-transferase family protein [Albibacillus kandeliae]
MKLYCGKGTISVVVYLALTEAGIAFEPVRVNFGEAEQTKPAYHAINPKGRVPALATDKGVLTETGAILDYIAAIAPNAGLVPADAFEAGRMRELMYYLASTMHVNHAHKMRGARWATEESSFEDMRAKVPETMAVSAAHIEERYALSTYVLGESLSLADLYLFVVCGWLAGDGVTIANYPKIAAFIEAMEQRESVKSAREAGLL